MHRNILKVRHLLNPFTLSVTIGNIFSSCFRWSKWSTEKYRAKAISDVQTISVTSSQWRRAHGRIFPRHTFSVSDSFFTFFVLVLSCLLSRFCSFLRMAFGLRAGDASFFFCLFSGVETALFFPSVVLDFFLWRTSSWTSAFSGTFLAAISVKSNGI